LAGAMSDRRVVAALMFGSVTSLLLWRRWRSAPTSSSEQPPTERHGFGAEALRRAFSNGERRGRAAFIGYFLAGYPSREETVSILLAMQKGGTDVIELGVPFSNPAADGPTIQKAHRAVLSSPSPTTLQDTLNYSKAACAQGLTVPIVLMGYYNPMVSYGPRELMIACVDSGIDGFIIVDLPPEEGGAFISLCEEFSLSFIPLLSPASTAERINLMLQYASSFIYCVSSAGVTGVRQTMPPGLEDYLSKVRSSTALPLAVGFGISTAEHVEQVGSVAEGVVVGSAILKAVDTAVSSGQSATRQRRL